MKVSLKVVAVPNGQGSGEDKVMLERFVGAEVVSNGKVLTTIALRSNILLEGTYTATRAEAVASQKASYTLRVKGTCGAHELPLGPPPPLWQAMDEKELARVLKEGHDVPLFLEVPGGAGVTVFVDSEPGAKVTIGEAELAPGKPGLEAGRDLWLSGCKLPLEVKVDGEVIGKLEGQEPAVFVSAKAEVCHEMGAVLYGDQGQPPFKRFVTRGRGVFALPMSPSHFLEFAPSTVRSSSKGTWVSQLVKVPCE
jgi:hypothetical protein